MTKVTLASVMTGLIIAIAPLASQQAFATKTFAPIDWESANSQQVITVRSAGDSSKSVLIAVTRAVMGNELESINVNCEGKSIIVAPGSAVLCEIGNLIGQFPTVTFSSISNKPSSGTYQVE